VPTSPSTRNRRFALPDHGPDDRAVEAIEAFLEGPEIRSHRPPAKRRPRKPAAATSANGAAPATGAAQANGAASARSNGAEPRAIVPATESRPVVMTVRPATDIRSIPGRLEFNAALERESIRGTRYARPASVAIVELVAERADQVVDAWVTTLARPVAQTLRSDTRATDLVARVAPGRFQVLLPETPEAGAGRFAERLAFACQASIDAAGAPVAVRVTVATSTPDHSLQDALAHALESIEAA